VFGWEEKTATVENHWRTLVTMENELQERMRARRRS
jgi:hypothetical protein